MNVTSKSNVRTAVITTGAVCCLLFFIGICEGVERPQEKPVSVERIQAMSNAGLLPQEIIDTIRGSGTVYRFREGQLAELSEQGIPDEVIDYMENGYLETVLNNQALKAWSYWNFDGQYWYGGVPYGWTHEYLHGAPDNERHEGNEP